MGVYDVVADRGVFVFFIEGSYRDVKIFSLFFILRFRGIRVGSWRWYNKDGGVGGYRVLGLELLY